MQYQVLPQNSFPFHKTLYPATRNYFLSYYFLSQDIKSVNDSQSLSSLKIYPITTIIFLVIRKYFVENK